MVLRGDVTSKSIIKSYFILFKISIKFNASSMVFTLPTSSFAKDEGLK